MLRATTMNRRHFLTAVLAAPWVAPLPGIRAAHAAPAAPPSGIAEMQARWRTLLAPGTPVPPAGELLALSNAEWKKRLSPAAYNVMREDGTERAFTSELNNEKRAGVFVCAGCALPVFTSEMKYDSGTGWPSFFTTIPGAFQTRPDNGLFYTRTEYHCARCGGHHGHVFNDGPPPTNQRWCNNGVALKFVPLKA